MPIPVRSSASGGPFSFTSGQSIWRREGCKTLRNIPPKVIISIMSMAENQTIAPNSTFNVTQHWERSVDDLVRHTGKAHEEWKKVFPFGYVIFVVREEKRMYKPEPGEELRWSGRWEDTQIVPDFDKKTVTWTLPGDFRAYKEDGSVDIRVNNSIMQTTFPLELGAGGPIHLLFGVRKNEPWPCGYFVGGTQRNPAFILGFRIITQP